uniref:phosphoribosylanthranilate isomerase n=1 Tax=Anopheles coluzzii TaxID=1518534 RepID=A0A8W7Q156_ANOCL
LGTDAIGLVFYQKSPRNVSIAQAQAVIAALPPFVSVVALFVNPEREWVEEVLAHCSIDMLQFHGEESAEFCRSFRRPYLKAVRVKPGLDLTAAAAQYPGRARAVDRCLLSKARTVAPGPRLTGLCCRKTCPCR